MKTNNIKSFYEIIPHPVDVTPGAWAVKIISGPYKDVVVYYGEVRFIPDPEKDTYTFNYERTYHFVPRWMRKKKFAQTERQALEDLVGDIIFDVMDDYLAQKPQE